MSKTRETTNIGRGQKIREESSNLPDAKVPNMNKAMPREMGGGVNNLQHTLGANRQPARGGGSSTKDDD